MYADVFGDLKIYMFLRRSFARISYMYMIFFLSVGTFGDLHPPPPLQYQKAGYATEKVPTVGGDTPSPFVTNKLL